MSRMRAGPVVVNSTPLVALWAIKRLDLLREIFGEVLIPQAVHDEFLAAETGQRAAALATAAWIKPVALAFPGRALDFTGLDRGEAEVIALADERQASLVVIDERRGRRHAIRLGLPVTGTIGLLLLGKEEGLLDEIGPLLTHFQTIGLYLHRDLIRQALVAAGEA